MANKKPSDAAGTVDAYEAENSAVEAEKAKSGQNTKPEGQNNAAKYTADEFARAYETVFDGEYHQDIIRTALKLAGVKEATIDEAKAIVAEFAHKEVSDK